MNRREESSSGSKSGPERDYSNGLWRQFSTGRLSAKLVRVMPILAAEGFRVLAVDLPGQGDSEVPASGYDTQTTRERVHALIETFGIDRYVVAGHDIGAWVEYPHAHQFRENLRDVVLLDVNIPGVTLQSTLTLGPANWRNWHFLFNPIPDPMKLFYKDGRGF